MSPQLAYGWARVFGLGASVALLGGVICYELGLGPWWGAAAGLLVAAVDVAAVPVRVRQDWAMGRPLRAAAGLRFLRSLALTARRRAALTLREASCYLSAGYLEVGGSLLRQVDRTVLPGPLRAVWDLDYAYYLLMARKEADRALRVLEECPEPSPTESPASRAVRGLALAERGLLPEAAAELTQALSRPDLSPAEVAELSFHLAQVWRRLGHGDYARDFLYRAAGAAPGSLYADLARQQLDESEAALAGS